jgi:hypothetical protein
LEVSQFTVDMIEKLTHLLRVKTINASSSRHYLSTLDYYFPVMTGLKARRFKE